MAFSGVTARGTANEKVSDTTHTLTPTGTIAAGKLAIVSAAIDNIGTTDADSTEITISDNAGGNTWVRAYERRESSGSAADGVTVGIYYCVLATQLTTSSTVTLTTSSSTTAKVFQLTEVTIGGSAVQIASGTNPVSTQAGTWTAADPTDVVLSGMASTEKLVVATIGSESEALTLTNDADYGTAVEVNTGTGGAYNTNLQVFQSTRIATLTGDTYGATHSTPPGPSQATHAWVAMLVAFEEVTGVSLTHIVLTTTPTLPAARVDHSLTHLVLTTTPTLPAATIQTAQSLTHIVLTTTPSLPVARLDHSVIHTVLTTVPTLPAATITAERTATHIVLTTTPTLPAARVDHSLTHIVLTVTPSLPAAVVTEAVSVTHVVLTTTPTYPVARLDHTLTHLVLTTTPSLPAATIATADSVTHTVLTITPSLPQASLTHSLTHIVLTTTPSLPASSIAQAITHLVLTTTPSLPVARVDHTLTHLVLTATPSLPPATLQTANDLVHATLTTTPTLPAARLDHSLTHVVLTATPTLPQADVAESGSQNVQHVVLTATPTFPAARLDLEVLHEVLEVAPSFPQATVDQAGVFDTVVSGRGVSDFINVFPVIPRPSFHRARVLVTVPELPRAYLKENPSEQQLEEDALLLTLI